MQNLNQSGRYSPVLLRNNLNDTEASFFAAHAFKFPGVELSARWVREYPEGESAAHVLGYVGRISEKDVTRLEEEGRSGNYRGSNVIRSEEHTSELQSLMRISYAVFCLKKKKNTDKKNT